MRVVCCVFEGCKLASIQPNWLPSGCAQRWTLLVSLLVVRLLVWPENCRHALLAAISLQLQTPWLYLLECSAQGPSQPSQQLALLHCRARGLHSQDHDLGVAADHVSEHPYRLTTGIFTGGSLTSASIETKQLSWSNGAARAHRRDENVAVNQL